LFRNKFFFRFYFHCNTLAKMDITIDEIFHNIINQQNPQPNSYPLGFELDSLKELFEFLLQLVTMLCKHFYCNDNGQVNLSRLSPADFQSIDKYMQVIGFTCGFQALPANADNINWAYSTRYDRIQITQQTSLEDLHLGLKCEDILYVISFKKI
jgi:hypothetical protein